ncbi:MAG: dual specificity protein phosphatase family protein [Parachlamydiaceae bacterium]|nr:dual specificity protein phosphatase family protein [Parachlamydiaceae bacterium]
MLVSSAVVNAKTTDPVIQYNRLGLLVARILRAIMSKGCFCWLSRFIIQVQSIIRPKHWVYWHVVTPQVFLGAIPLHNWNHSSLITGEGASAILSINEPHEFESQCCARPMVEEDWKLRSVHFLNISSPDLEPVPVAKLAEAVNYVAIQIEKEFRNVYIHCTGGRGRSVSVAACVLMKQEKMSCEQAVSCIQKLRPQAMISPQQVATIREWALKYLGR